MSLKNVIYISIDAAMYLCLCTDITTQIGQHLSVGCTTYAVTASYVRRSIELHVCIFKLIRNNGHAFVINFKNLVVHYTVYQTCRFLDSEDELVWLVICVTMYRYASRNSTILISKRRE